MNQFMLSSVLIKMGYPCVVARNGAEAVAIAQEGGFDIIFMDLHMPVMDGLEATRRIREYYVASATPVIIGLTANALMQEKETSLKAGLNDFLIKPYKPQDIQHVLIKWGGKVREAVQHPS
jgi:CheY-like chemotaxis protein